jgi:predicted ester cyclase
MSLQDNKAVSNRIAEAVGAHDFDAVDRLVSHELAPRFKQQMAEMYQAFPDFHGGNDLQVAEGDHVANRFRYWGTHRGEFMGIPPTGREVVFEGITIDEIREGRVVGISGSIDPGPVIAQLGAALRVELPQAASPAR